MKAKRLTWAFLLLFGAAYVQVDAFTQVASDGQTNKLSTTNVDFVPDNSIEALKTKAEQGNIIAQGIVGYAYEKGKDVSIDYGEAVKWYQRSAQQGDIGSQSALGGFYYDGKGVPKNNIEAYKWFNLAAAHSANDDNERKVVQSAANMRDLMVKIGDITPEEIAEAKRLSAAFVPRKETPVSSSDNSVSSNNPRFSGTGFFITEDGYLISNYHVVKDATKVCLLTSAGLINAIVVSVDPANDLALLKVNIPVPPAGYVLEHGFSSLPIAASRTVNLGGTVATVGFPNIGMQGFAPKLAKGEIASLSGASDDPRYFQISVPVQPGNSGGALVDERGNVIGIVSAKLDASVALAASGALPENVNYAVKSSLLLSFLESVPDVAKKLREPNTKDQPFEAVVKSAQGAAVLVLVY